MLIDQLSHIQVPKDYNASDPHNSAMIIKEQAQMCMNMLSRPQPSNAEELHQLMVEHCRKWDEVYGYNARELYPELADIWNHYGY
jgi:hypothetical protein